MRRKTDAPRFSIITVTFNAEAVLERTFQSVSVQSYPNIEYLVIDGASRDRTLTICQRYASIITEIVSEPDHGLYDAMNKGIRRASGDYLIFLNAGDQLKDADTLLHAAERIQACGEEWPDVVYGETEIIDADNRFVRMRRLSAPDRLNWHSFRQGMLVCHQAFWVSCELAQQIPYDLIYRFSADFDWCVRIMKRANMMLNTRRTLIRYLQGGMSIQNHRASLFERFRIMVRHYGWLTTVCLHIWFVLRAVIKQ